MQESLSWLGRLVLTRSRKSVEARYVNRLLAGMVKQAQGLHERNCLTFMLDYIILNPFKLGMDNVALT